LLPIVGHTVPSLRPDGAVEGPEDSPEERAVDRAVDSAVRGRVDGMTGAVEVHPPERAVPIDPVEGSWG